MNNSERSINSEKLLSVDESLVLFKGRLKFKQYIKTKRSLYGIKLYELPTSHGISLDLLVYSGKGMFGEGDPNSGMPATERIPSVLMEIVLFLEKAMCFTRQFLHQPGTCKALFEKQKTPLWDNSVQLQELFQRNYFRQPSKVASCVL